MIPDVQRCRYDDRNRLKEIRQRSGGGVWNVLQEVDYDDSGAGNIAWKSDVGSYGYGADGAGPHVVTSAGGRSWYYDANGNAITDGSRIFEYTAFNKLRRVLPNAGALRTTFDYGPGREKVLKRELQGTTVQSRTHYVGNVEVVWDGVSPGQNSGEYRRYIGGVALVTFYDSTGITRVRYQHKDHLGSVTAIADQSRNIVATMGFDPWDQRRDPEDLSQPWEQWTNPAAPAWAELMLELTPRGYTGHEQLDDHGIVHMGGRIYDPHLARFLQADPLIEDSTTLNRYSYVLNNPLAYTDPSGYSFKNALGKFARISPALRSTHELNKVVANNQYLDGAASAAACYWGGPWGCAAASAVGTHYRGGSVKDALKAGFISGATAAAFSQVGSHYGDIARTQGGSLTAGQFTSQIVAHGIIGGVSAELQGGKFAHGFISAGVTKAASPAITNLPGGAPIQIAAAAIVGGTVSHMTGGKFANGAITAAMGYMFNQMSSNQDIDRQGTVDMLRACDAGNQSVCASLADINQQHLEEALSFINEHFSDITDRIDSMPEIKFNYTVGFWEQRFGSTTFWAGNIELSAGYNSLADLTGNVAHELLHTGDGRGGRMRMNIQDIRSRNSSPYGMGSRHTEIHEYGNRVRDTYMDYRGWK